jgi:hypothetical protein
MYQTINEKFQCWIGWMVGAGRSSIQRRDD